MNETKNQPRKAVFEYWSPDGSPITGRIEVIDGTASVRVTRGEGGKPEVEHQGGTNVHWDSQQAKKDDKGREIYVADDGGEWNLEDLVLHPTEPCYRYTVKTPGGKREVTVLPDATTDKEALEAAVAAGGTKLVEVTIEDDGNIDRTVWSVDNYRTEGAAKRDLKKLLVDPALAELTLDTPAHV